MDVIKKYWNNVYQYILLLTPCACMCAGLIYTFGKFAGWHPDTSWFWVILFDSSQFVYLFISLYFIYHKKKVSYYSEKDIFCIKTFITISLFIQYNFIIHCFPTQDTWSCTFIFMGFVAFLFDMKLMLVHILGYTLFLIIGHILYWEHLVPKASGTELEIMSFRIVVYLLTSLSVVFITFFVQKFLMQQQEEEAENIFLMEKQLEYYQNCDMMDRELRKFRHDIKGHFLGMGYLLEKQNYEELTCYFNDLQDSFAFQERLYFSGNLIIDSIINYDLHNLCASYVQKNVSGVLTDVSTVSSIDLCTIFSNMLSNAIHAVNQCPPQELPQLTISFDYGSQYFSITIVNSISDDYSANRTIKKRNTSDRNHGYGIYKMKNICEKYNGIFHQSIQTKQIITTVYLPL